jgi:hypothetical protein
MDFHNDIGVHVVPETEEFIEQIGHMATEDEIAFLQVGGWVGGCGWLGFNL